MRHAVDPYEGHHPDALDLTGYELAFDEDFTDPALDSDRWVAHYLPHWTTPERSAARYDLRPGVLRLRIDADQPAWRVADGELRVSNIQTGTFSGPLGSPIGQHRHRRDLAVRTGAVHPPSVHPFHRAHRSRPTSESRPDLHAGVLAGGVRGGVR